MKFRSVRAGYAVRRPDASVFNEMFRVDRMPISGDKNGIAKS